MAAYPMPATTPATLPRAFAPRSAAAWELERELMTITPAQDASKTNPVQRATAQIICFVVMTAPVERYERTRGHWPPQRIFCNVEPQAPARGTSHPANRCTDSWCPALALG